MSVGCGSSSLPLGRFHQFLEGGMNGYKFPKLTFLLFNVITVFFALYLGTSGSFAIKVEGDLPNLFEVLWARVTDGLYDVPWDVARHEGIVKGGHIYVYYGFFPAIIRGLGLALLDDSWANKMGGLSCAIALCVIAAFSFLIVFESLRFWQFRTKNRKNLLLAIISFSAVIGSPVLGCIIRPYFYEELILWGYAFSTIGIYGFIKFLDDKNSNLAVFLLSISASFAFISRATFGMPLYILVGVVFFVLLYKRKLSICKIMLLSFSLMGVSFQFWYNYVRFDSPFVFAPTDAHDIYFQHVAKHGGVLNLRRAKELFLYYFLPTRPSSTFSYHFPFFRSVYYHFNDEEIFMNYYCNVSPMLVVLPSTLLFYLSAFFIYISAHIRRIYKLILKMLIFCLPFILETMIILSYNACFERYKLEFMPLVMACLFFSFREIKNRKFLTMALILCILSLAFNICWAIGYKPYAG